MQEIFRTPLAVQPSRFRISHHSKILCIGSCFTENIGGRLETYRFPVMINPAGIQYNPDSVGNTIRRLIRNEEYRPDELHRDGDMWFSWDHHGSFSSTGRERCLEKINTALSEGAAFIREAEYLCITFGTAYGYTLTETGETVSNCHKQPGSLFTRSFIEPDAIVSRFTELAREISEVNPELRFIFTVSPVRHLKDGLPENQKSKASLILAVHKLCSILEAEYFPAYEIVTDELRDYRFYDGDMVHPNETAVSYIWKKFSDTYFDEETESICSELEAIISGLNHRPIHPESESHRRFLENLDRRIESFRQKYPFIPLPR